MIAMERNAHLISTSQHKRSGARHVIKALTSLPSRDAGRNVSTIADYDSKRAVTAYRLADEMLKAR
jgi:hypothetical protein